MNHFKYKDYSSGASTTWEPLGQTLPNPPADNSSDDHAQMKKLIDNLTQAVLDPGTNKMYYIKTLTRHRTEWPHLWEKIDSIVSFVAESNKTSE